MLQAAVPMDSFLGTPAAQMHWTWIAEAGMSRMGLDTHPPFRLELMVDNKRLMVANMAWGPMRPPDEEELSQLALPLVLSR